MNIGTLNRVVANNRILTMSVASLACAIILGFSSLVRIPVPGTPVPITLQTFALLACAGLLGRYYALQVVAWYVLLGLVGAPFFADGSGYTHIIGATGGYIWGFFFAAAIVGFFGNAKRGWISGIAIYLLAAFALYAPGLLQLKLVTGADWMRTLAMGFLPFIIVDLVKAVVAFCGVKFSKRFVGNL